MSMSSLVEKIIGIEIVKISDKVSVSVIELKGLGELGEPWSIYLHKALRGSPDTFGSLERLSDTSVYGITSDVRVYKSNAMDLEIYKMKKVKRG